MNSNTNMIAISKHGSIIAEQAIIVVGIGLPSCQPAKSVDRGRGLRPVFLGQSSLELRLWGDVVDDLLFVICYLSFATPHRPTIDT